jgi:tryptophanyl-tRNA synthetase
MLDEPAEVWERVRTAVTDPQRIRRSDPGRPEVCNVFSLHKLFAAPDELSDIEVHCREATRGCVDCKRILADRISDHFAETRDRARDLAAHPVRVREILDAGAVRAREEAGETLGEVRDRMGMRWRDLPMLSS